MSMLLSALLSALIPVGVEGAKQLIAKKVGGIQPTTIEDKIKLDDSDIKRAQAIAALDNPGGTPSQWVIDLRASSRYIAAWLCILIGAVLVWEGLKTSHPEFVAAGGELVSVAFGFLFGTRIVAGWGQK